MNISENFSLCYLCQLGIIIIRPIRLFLHVHVFDASLYCIYALLLSTIIVSNRFICALLATKLEREVISLQRMTKLSCLSILTNYFTFVYLFVSKSKTIVTVYRVSVSHFLNKTSKN